jgi:hypothetical protein
LHSLIACCPISWSKKGREKKEIVSIFSPHDGQQIRLFLLTVALVIRSEAACESTASIPIQHIHDNRALDHESLDEGVMLHWNAPSLHLADPFAKASSSNKHFFQLKDKHWIFFKNQLEEIFDFLEDSAPMNLRYLSLVLFPGPPVTCYDKYLSLPMHINSM